MAEEKNHEPIQQSVCVDCPIDEAFRLFTESFGEWWPLALHSLTGAKAQSCEMEPWTGGRILERTRSGEEHEWGSVLAWDPPGHLEFSWHPGGPADRRQTVDVTFQVEADGTRVTLIHTGWEAPGVATCAVCFAGFVVQEMLVAF